MLFVSRLQLRIVARSIVARTLRTGLEDVAWFGAGIGRGLLEGEFVKERDDGRVVPIFRRASASLSSQIFAWPG